MTEPLPEEIVNPQPPTQEAPEDVPTAVAVPDPPTGGVDGSETV